MKVAVPTKKQVVDSHFGHCDHYTIATVSEEKELQMVEKFKAPKGCGCKSNIAGVLKEMGVKTMLVGNIGQGAINKINASGIDLIRGCEGLVDDVIKAYLDGELTDLDNVCSHPSHDGDHQCSHN